MELELKHIVPYLPYGLKFILNFPFHTVKGTMVAIGVTDDYMVTIHLKLKDNSFKQIRFLPSSSKVKKRMCKAVLKPLSDLTLEYAQSCNYSSLESFKEDIITGFLPVIYWNKLLEQHYDVFSLISAGLALNEKISE